MTTFPDPMKGPSEPGVLPETEGKLREAFLSQVDGIPGGALLNRCIQCGTCSGSCPVNYAMDFSPREVIAMFRAGAIETLLRSRTIWICASCYNCTARCPSGIKITDLLYALKRIAIERKLVPSDFPVYVMSEAFVDNVRRYGRNYELRLILRYFLRANPFRLLKGMGEGMALWRHGRMALRPDKIKGLKGLQRIIAKAETFDRPQELVAREKVTDAVGYHALKPGVEAAK